MERVVAENNVVYYRSELIPCVHAFSTRLGGVSALPHTESMNLAFGRGDDRETVIENLRLFAEAVGFEAENTVSVDQVHSDRIRQISRTNFGEGYFKESLESCDGYISTEPDAVIGVKTADCVPILIYAPPNGSFGGAVMALHAGWRGTALGIASKAVERAVSLGATASEMKVAIGPSIGKCCYEVRDDFYAEFCKHAGRELTEKYVTPCNDGEHFLADLKGANRELLERSGVLSLNIDVSKTCTCCEPDEFFSHRYTGGVRGTMLAVIKNKLR